MEFKQYINKRNKPVFMYIHGECLSTFSFKIETKELKKDFTVILPIIGNDFKDIESAADEIIAFIDKKYKGHIAVLSGFSLGGQIAINILSKRPDFCDHAIIEEARMEPMKIRNWSDLVAVYANPLAQNKLFNSFMYYTKFNKDFAEKEYYQNFKQLSKDTVKNQLESTYSFTMPENLNQVTCQMAIMVGQRVRKAYKHSADLLHEQVPNSHIFMLMNYTHGDFSLGHPEEFIRFVKSWIQKKDKQQRKAAIKEQPADEGIYMPNWKHILLRLKEKHQKRISQPSSIRS